jgi:hypothetical protein
VLRFAVGLLYVQAIVLGLGLQHKSVDDMEKELELPAGQVLGLFNRSVRKFVQVCAGDIKRRRNKYMVTLLYSEGVICTVKKIS